MLSVVVLSLFSASTLVSAQSTPLPACVKTCVDQNLMSSFCDGDEQGEALATCTCNTLRGSRMIKCIRTCSSTDQAVYAGRLPATCARELFPGVNAASPTTTSSNGRVTSSVASPASITTSATTTTATTSSSNIAVYTRGPELIAVGIAAAMLLA